MDREDLYALIYEISGVRTGISASTRIYHDLFIAGDDAEELLQRIQNIFQTDFGSMDFDAYFPNETDAIFWGLAMRLGIRCRKKELTVGHLIEVIGKGAWFDPI